MDKIKVDIMVDGQIYTKFVDPVETNPANPEIKKKFFEMAAKGLYMDGQPIKPLVNYTEHLNSVPY